MRRGYAYCFESTGCTHSEAELHAAGKKLVERGCRHGGVNRMHRVGAHRHQDDAEPAGLRQHRRGAGDRLAVEEVRSKPQIGCARCLRCFRQRTQQRRRLVPVHRHPDLHEMRSYARSSETMTLSWDATEGAGISFNPVEVRTVTTGSAKTSPRARASCNAANPATPEYSCHSPSCASSLAASATTSS